MTDATTSPSATDPRMVVRDAIAEVMAARWRERARAGVQDSPEGHCADLADVALGLFEVGEETWLIVTVPGVNGPVDIKTQIRMPDREPVTHTRLVLRTEPVPVRPGEARGDADVPL